MGVKSIAAKKGPDSVRHGMRWLQDLGAIVIDPARTPNIAREFSGYEYKQDRFGNFLAEYPDKDNHAIDATRYALESIATENKVKTINRAALGI
jgi:phage terminase large subunit